MANPQPLIAIMRPKRYEAESIHICQAIGFEVISAPMIEILDKKDQHFDGFVERVLAGRSDIVIFTSANGIDHTLDKITDQKEFIQALNRCKTIAIGPKTREAAQNKGITISFVPQSYSSECLVKDIAPDVKGKVVDIARSSHGAPILVEGLENAGAEVFETRVYEIARPNRNAQQEELIQAITENKVDAIAFTSSMMVRNLFELASEMGVQDKVTQALNSQDLIVAAIGDPTSKTLNIYKLQVNIISKEYTFEALINEVQKEFDILMSDLFIEDDAVQIIKDELAKAEKKAVRIFISGGGCCPALE
ncbi:MAG: uroporphyrinogen-III synthase, partial [Nitrospirae bacterium]|nr:uroporphyrinogen-III synthase [Nitrospirota bacterium]